MSNPSRTVTASVGRAQLSLVEHALCPLNARQSLTANLRFETAFQFSDRYRNRKRAQVSIAALHGLSPSDDLYLWGLLGLALSQPEPSPDFHATPYWCLKNLGIIDGTKKGSEDYRLFREAIRRIAGVRYACDAFYDPIRGEHREVSFGFLSYSLPRSDGPSRTWRFAWDPIFWELCSSNAGALRFDLPTYRGLSPAARRMFLLLKKLFWRSDATPELEVRDLAINVLGFSSQSPTKELKRKIASIVGELLQQDLVQLGLQQGSVNECITKYYKGIFKLKLYRGAKFDKLSVLRSKSMENSPLFDPLQAIGFDHAAITKIIRDHPAKLVQLWADITLAAIEQKRIKDTPQAFFRYYLRRAGEKLATPPDWWREIDRKRRREEEEQRIARDHLVQESSDRQSFEDYLAGEAKATFDNVMQTLKSDLIKAGRSESEAKEFAREHALIHCRNKFMQRA